MTWYARFYRLFFGGTKIWIINNSQVEETFEIDHGLFFFKFNFFLAEILKVGRR